MYFKKKSNMSARILLIGVLSIFMVAGSALAHTLFLQSTRYRLDEPGSARMFFGWGHLLPLHDPVAGEKIAALKLIKPDGTSEPITVTKGRSFHPYAVEYETPGCHILYGETVPGYYTMYLGQDGKIHHFVGPMDEVEDAKRITFSVRCWQHAKAIVVVGKHEEGQHEPGHVCPARKPVGGKFELIPGVCPGKVASGDRFFFDVLFDGKPLKAEGVTFNTTYLGYSTKMEDYIYADRPIVDGKGFFDICRPGVWYIEAEYQVPATPEFAKKCRHFLYHATLVLEVLPKST